MSKVFVQVGPDDIPIRIFKTTFAATRHEPASEMKLWPKNEATKAIRSQVWKRSKGLCENCGARLTLHNGEMDEIHARGERNDKGEYGEVSVANCWMLCHGCHTGRKDSQHGNRRWQSAPPKERLFDDEG